MFSRVRSFLSRHRRKFVVTGVVVGGAYLLSRYVRKALKDWQENETKNFLERTRKQQHYESIERTCNQTALTLIPPMKETITSYNNTEALIEKIKEGNCNKVAVWESLKFLAFSKLTLFIYVSSLLMVTLRLQLNLIGGYMFRNTMGDSKDEITSAMQEKYLSVSQFLLTDGITKLSALVKEKVEFVLSSRSLKEKLTLQDIEQIFWAIHSAISNDPKNPCQHLPSYILPHNDVSLPQHQQVIYHKIIAETRDLLESEEVISLASSSVNRGFSYFMDNLAEYFVDRSTMQCAPNHKSLEPAAGSSNTPDAFFAANMSEGKRDPIVDISRISIPMAKLIPIVNGLVSSRESKTDIPHTWMQQLILMDNLKVLGANIYEAFTV